MSTTIKIKCIDQTLTYEGTPTVASGGVNEDYVQFEFCSQWDGYSKVAVFYQNKGVIYYSLVSTENIAVIPKEVIATKGIMYLGVMGVKDNVTLTSQVLQYHIESGALDGFTPEEPTQEIYQQILAELQSIRDLSAETLSNEEAFEKAITEQQESYETDLNNQWSTYKTETDKEIAEKLSKVYRPCGSVATYDDLPTDAEVGDVYNLLDTGVNYAWTGTEWDSLAGIVDLSGYVEKTDIIDNLTSTNTDKPLSAKQGKTLKGLIDTETSKRETLDGKTLKYLGRFQGDFDSTSIPYGIYYAWDMHSTCTNVPAEIDTDDWVLFIQYPDVYHTQILEATYTNVKRDYTGDPAKWNSWWRGLTNEQVQDNLTQTTTDYPLSANQGRVLNNKITNNVVKVANTGWGTSLSFTYNKAYQCLVLVNGTIYGAIWFPNSVPTLIQTGHATETVTLSYSSSKITLKASTSVAITVFYI